MFTTDLVNLYNRNIFKATLYIQGEKCRLMRNLYLWTAHTLANAIIFTTGSIVYNCSTQPINRHLYSGIFKYPLDTQYKIFLKI